MLAKEENFGSMARINRELIGKAEALDSPQRVVLAESFVLNSPGLLTRRFIRDISTELRAFVSQPEMPDEGDFVRVMSLHKSTGTITITTTDNQPLPLALINETPAYWTSLTLPSVKVIFRSLYT
jgi:hypothetical protein